MMLTGLVDYAGLFPPAGRPMADAVQAYASYRRGRWAWALGRFVVPAVRLDEFDAFARSFLPSGEGAIPWRLSALVSGDPAGDLGRIADFNVVHGPGSGAGRAVVDVIEARIGVPGDVTPLRAIVPAGVSLVCELPLDGGLDQSVGAIEAAGAVAKARLGGTVADAFPSSAFVAEFLGSCARRRVAFKATAGLHHPVRSVQRLSYEPTSAEARMHGFLNVFIAAALAWDAAVRGEEPDVAGLVRVLDCEDPRAFAFDESAASWSGRRISLDVLSDMRRRFALSFGSCSFEEPIDDLRALGWSV